MEKVTFDNFIELVESYNPDEVEYVKDVYLFADELHKGQKRQSGEDYILHPLNVAHTLALMNADRDTLCASLLHDVLEDCDITYEDLIHRFNLNIANLVRGVTKISKMNFNSKNEQNMANTRKIIASITDDVRIIVIKLADRLHNMRTLSFKNEFKQKENAQETLDIFVPLAYYIGAYRIKTELEDLSLMYLNKDLFEDISYKRKIVEKESMDAIDDAMQVVKKKFEDRNMLVSFKKRIKNVYGIYQRLNCPDNLYEIHDLFAIKIIVDKIDDCYLGLGVIHDSFIPINNRFKDYIVNPKTNMYKSLHTTVFIPDNWLAQFQIRTVDMDKIASFGLCAYWDFAKGEARKIMQNNLKKDYQFFDALVNYSVKYQDNSVDNEKFVKNVKSKIFGDNVYVYSQNGIIIELPKGSTVADYVNKVFPSKEKLVEDCYVNDKLVNYDFVLETDDRVRVVIKNSFLTNDVFIKNASNSLLKRKK